MKEYEVVIIGGGPAGAACAGKLIQAGLKPLVVDKDLFPRNKVCAGWLTPEVFNLLGVLPENYPGQLSVFPYLKIYLNGFPIRRRGIQYAIRRLEFDYWLLNRCGAEVIQGEVKDIQVVNGKYCLDGEIKAEFLVGAGGTHCPVYRKFFASENPRSGTQIIALEDEIQEDWVDPICRLWFFENELPGYAWYVPKDGGYINLGVGGNAAILKQRESTIQSQWDYFVDKVRRLGLVKETSLDPLGSVYHLRGQDPAPFINNLYLVGDAAGLATLDMGEGIGPAIQSGQLAADAILGESPYNLNSVSSYSLLPAWLRWLI